MKQQEPDGDNYDVCIVGAGPAGLACLSALREPFSVDHLTETQFQRALYSIKRHHPQQQQQHRKLRVCVIDPKAGWLHGWRTNFAQLRIEHLRSPAMAHPDFFDTNALLAYACHHQRDSNELFESGCSALKQLHGLGETQVGLWKLPSSELFLDFCLDLVDRLPHARLQGHVDDIRQQNEATDGATYEVYWSDPSYRKHSLRARSVILATGIVGKPVIPRGLETCPTVSWMDTHAFPQAIKPTSKNTLPKERVLVVGGGLTAVQTALRVVQDGHQCVLCSRRPLQEKHFDIPVEWFDRRTSNKCLSEIYHDSVHSRLRQLRAARDGGSVPPMYMKRLEKCRHCILWVGELEYQKEAGDARAQVTICFEGSIYKFDRVILACGVSPDCSTHPVFSKILDKWPIPIHGGYPLISEDLQWDKRRHRNLYVVGAMAALQVGPDAGNLMGIRRAAIIAANALDCRRWLREKVLDNPFDALEL